MGRSRGRDGEYARDRRARGGDGRRGELIGLCDRKQVAYPVTKIRSRRALGGRAGGAHGVKTQDPKASACQRVGPSDRKICRDLLHCMWIFLFFFFGFDRAQPQRCLKSPRWAYTPQLITWAAACSTIFLEDRVEGQVNGLIGALFVKHSHLQNCSRNGDHTSNNMTSIRFVLCLRSSSSRPAC